MRITGGQYRSRQLKTPKGASTRPTSGMVRETLFNILMPVLPGAIFLDLYAGCGSVGLEALSRGAERAIFVEHARPALACLQANIHELDLEDDTEMVPIPVDRALAQFAAAHRRFDLIFLDPPFADTSAYHQMLQHVATSNILADDGILVAQHDTHLKLPENFERLHRYRRKDLGDNALSFYRFSDEA